MLHLAIAGSVAIIVTACCCCDEKKKGAAPAPTAAEQQDTAAAADIMTKMREGYCIDFGKKKGVKCTTWHDAMRSIDARRRNGVLSVSVQTSLYPKNSNQDAARSLCTTVKRTRSDISKVNVYASDTRLMAYTDWGDDRLCSVRDMD